MLYMKQLYRYSKTSESNMDFKIIVYLENNNHGNQLRKLCKFNQKRQKKYCWHQGQQKKGHSKLTVKHWASTYWLDGYV